MFERPIAGKAKKLETMVVSEDTPVATGQSLLNMLTGPVVEELLHRLFIMRVR